MRIASKSALNCPLHTAGVGPRGIDQVLNGVVRAFASSNDYHRRLSDLGEDSEISVTPGNEVQTAKS